MPRNNGNDRRAHRQKIAQANEQRRKDELAQMQLDSDRAAFEVLLDVQQVIENAAIYDSPYAEEIMRQRSHFCGDGGCGYSRYFCAMINQNMPPHLIVRKPFSS